MTREEGIRRQLELDRGRSARSDEESYKLLFELLEEEPKSFLKSSFEDSVISRLKGSSIISWKEYLTLGLIFLLPILGMIYFQEFAQELWNLPTIGWLRNHLAEIVFGIVIIIGVQFADRLVKKKLHLTE